MDRLTAIARIVGRVGSAAAVMMLALVGLALPASADSGTALTPESCQQAAQQANNLKSSLDELDSKRAAIEQEADELDQKMADTQAQIDAKYADPALTGLASLDAQLADLDAQITAHNAEAATIDQTDGAAVDAYNARADQLDAAAADLNAKVDAANAAAAALLSEVTKLESSLASDQLTAKLLAQQLADLQQQLADLGNQREQVVATVQKCESALGSQVVAVLGRPGHAAGAVASTDQIAPQVLAVTGSITMILGAALTLQSMSSFSGQSRSGARAALAGLNARLSAGSPGNTIGPHLEAGSPSATTILVDNEGSAGAGQGANPRARGSLTPAGPPPPGNPMGTPSTSTTPPGNPMGTAEDHPSDVSNPIGKGSVPDAPGGVLDTPSSDGDAPYGPKAD